MTGQFNFNAAFMSSAAIMPVPVHRPWTRRRPDGQPQRSNSASRADQPAPRRAMGHSRRPSSGNQAGRPSHEASLQTDRPAGALAASAGGTVQKHAADSAAWSWLSLLKHRPRLAEDASAVDLSSPPRLSPNSLGPSRRGLQFSARAASAESVSSTSASTSQSARTTMTSVPSSSIPRDSSLASRPFVVRNGRVYLGDSSVPYPLPSDLAELHRQSLRTLLLIQLFGGPVCCPALIKKPPQRVLEIGCGSGFWSMICHEYYKSRGYGDISFTGVDIAPLNHGSTSLAAKSTKPDKDMDWRFFQQDICASPWSVLKNEEFDLVMVKDMSLAVTSRQQLRVFGQYLRLLKPGGTIEIWESDHHIRMLRPHVRTSMPTADAGEQETALKLGAYVLSANTPLSAPLNPFLIDYNNWLSHALEARELSAVPCTHIGPALLQEAETLVDIRSRRLAIPLNEARWEREEAGAVEFSDGSSNANSKRKEYSPVKTERASISDGQKALRATALLTVVQQVQALEPALREVSGKGQDEWDVWMEKMMSDIVGDNGANWGECLEVGAWWATKKTSQTQED